MNKEVNEKFKQIDYFYRGAIIKHIAIAIGRNPNHLRFRMMKKESLTDEQCMKALKIINLRIKFQEAEKLKFKIKH